MFGSDDLLDNEAKLTVFKIALAQNSLELIQSILDEGLDLHAQDEMGFTPFHRACRRGSLQAIQLICKHKTDVIQITESMKSIISPAGLAVLASSHSTTNDTSVLEYLITLGVKLNIPDGNGILPFHYSVKDRNLKAAEIIYNNYNQALEDTTLKGCTWLYFAIKDQAHDIIDRFLPLTNNINKVDNMGDNALHIIAQHDNNSKIIEQLVKKGADVNQENDYLISPLELAMTHQSDDVAATLLQYGAKINGIVEQILQRGEITQKLATAIKWARTADNIYSKYKAYEILDEEQSNFINSRIIWCLKHDFNQQNIFKAFEFIKFAKDNLSNPLLASIYKEAANMIGEAVKSFVDSEFPQQATETESIDFAQQKVDSAENISQNSDNNNTAKYFNLPLSEDICNSNIPDCKHLFKFDDNNQEHYHIISTTYTMLLLGDL